MKRYSWPYPLTLFLLFVLTACPDNPPSHHRDSTIHLSVVNEGTFSVRLKVSVEDSSDVWTFRLNRDDSTVAAGSSMKADTTIRDGGLLPGHTYRYRAYWLDGGEATDSSEEVTATTMDTTSHNFTWEIDTLGNYGSYLNDVAIVSEDNIWVVGYITTDTATYNAAHWNGSEWELILISPAGLTNPISCVFAFNENDIWFGKVGLPVHWDGHNYFKYTPANSTHPGQPTINAIWGSSPNNIYFVGDNGSIVHYDGSTFRRMESGTEIRLIAIDGTDDGDRVYISGYEFIGENAGYSIALEFKNGINWDILYTSEGLFSEPYGIIKTVTVLGKYAVFGCTEGVWRYNYDSGASELWTKNELEWDHSINKIKAVAENDIIIVSNWGMVNHFNGDNWRKDDAISTLINNDGSFLTGDVSFDGNTIIIAGKSNQWDAIVIKGNR